MIMNSFAKFESTIHAVLSNLQVDSFGKAPVILHRQQVNMGACLSVKMNHSGEIFCKNLSGMLVAFRTLLKKIIGCSDSKREITRSISKRKIM